MLNFRFYNGSAVGTSHLSDNAVATAKIASEAVTSAKIADQAVTLAKLPHGTSSNDGSFYEQTTEQTLHLKLLQVQQ